MMITPHSITKVMELSQYPQAIATTAQAVNDLDLGITQVKRQIARFENCIDAEVTTNPELKNDAIRKAERFRILENNTAYQKLLDELGELNHQRSTAMAELERVRNEFSVAKIAARAGMVIQIAALDCHEFVGL